MDWTQTRKKLLQLATGRPEPVLEEGAAVSGASAAAGAVPATNGRQAALSAWPATRAEPPREGDGGARTPTRSTAADERLGRAVRARSLCVASGKGGTGKSVVAAALASLFSSRGRTLVVDADLGVGNAHILQDVSPPRTIVDVVEGRQCVRDVLVPCSGQVDLLAAGSGVPRLANLSSYEMHLVATGLEELEFDYRFLLVDSAAGVSRQTISFARASDLTLIVTTPDLTAMTDAYAFLKVLLGRRPEPRPLLLVNRARDEAEANDVTQRIVGVCDRFLGVRPRPIGWLPDDEAVISSVNRRGSVVVLEPHSEAAYSLRRTAVILLEELSRHHPRGLGHTLLADVGFSKAPA